MKHQNIKYITVYILKRTYIADKTEGSYYEVAKVDTVFKYQNTHQRTIAIRKAKELCDSFYQKDKGYWQKYDYKFFKEEKRKDLGRDYRTIKKYYKEIWGDGISTKYMKQKY